MKTNIIFANNLKYYRYQKNYSQDKLVSLVNMDKSYYSGLENGKHVPSFEILDSICAALKIEPYLLFKYNKAAEKLPERITEYRKHN